MTDFMVKASTLAAAAQDIQTSSNRLRSVLDSMDQELSPLKSQWIGSAAENYQAAKARWETTLNDMNSLLADIGKLVDTSNQQFSSADSRNAQLWS